MKKATRKPEDGLKKLNLKPPVIEPIPLPENIKPLTPKPLVDELIRQAIYDVLNVHNPKTCIDRPCKAVAQIEALINKEKTLARLDELLKLPPNAQVANGYVYKRTTELQQSEHSIREDKSL